MEAIKGFQKTIEPWLAYLDYCFNREPLAHICQPFWNWTIGAVVGLGVIAVLVGIAKYVSYRRKLVAAIRSQEERERIADDETMKSALWDGDKAYQSHLKDSDVLNDIKRAVAQRRNENQPSSPQA